MPVGLDSTEARETGFCVRPSVTYYPTTGFGIGGDFSLGIGSYNMTHYYLSGNYRADIVKYEFGPKIVFCPNMVPVAPIVSVSYMYGINKVSADCNYYDYYWDGYNYVYINLNHHETYSYSTHSLEAMLGVSSFINKIAITPFISYSNDICGYIKYNGYTFNVDNDGFFSEDSRHLMKFGIILSYVFNKQDLWNNPF